MSLTLYTLDEAFAYLDVDKAEGLKLIDSPNGPQISRIDGQMHIAETHLQRFLTDRTIPASRSLTDEELAEARMEYHIEQAKHYGDLCRDIV